MITPNVNYGAVQEWERALTGGEPTSSACLQCQVLGKGVPPRRQK